MGFAPVRLVTIHPALTHFTIGLLPAIVVAYAMAVWRRPPGEAARWTFAGDLALLLAAAFTVLTLGSGLASNFILFWPGGLGSWRTVHLVGGVLSSAGLLALALGRILGRRALARGVDLAGSLVVALMVLATGWVGGEVLVFHAGMAVEGGALGALAPPVGEQGAPSDFTDAMGGLRAQLAAIVDEVAVMTIERPADERFDRVVMHARTIDRLATWLAQHPRSLGPPRGHEHDGHGREKHPVAGHGDGERAGAGDEGPGAAEPDLEIENYAEFLHGAAARLASTAAARDLQSLAAETGQALSTCAACHASVRWK